MTQPGPAEELTDAELDVVLASADDELLAYSQASASPTPLIVDIMNHEDGFSRELVSDDSLHGEAAIRIILQRSAARDLELTFKALHERASAFWDILPPTVPNDLDISRARAQASEILNDLSLAAELAHSISRDLLYVCRRSSRKAMNVVHSLNGEQVCVRENVKSLILNMAMAKNTARGRVQDLVRVDVDVSGADLSELPLDESDVDILTGVVWTRETQWPPELGGVLLFRSEEIQAGIYQVRHGSERDPSDLSVV